MEAAKTDDYKRESHSSSVRTALEVLKRVRSGVIAGCMFVLLTREAVACAQTRGSDDSYWQT
jgi:hypothetical protein